MNCLRRYRFSPSPLTWEALKNAVVASLRKDGFTAYREDDAAERVEFLVTNATVAQVALSCGRGNLLHL